MYFVKHLSCLKNRNLQNDIALNGIEIPEFEYYDLENYILCYYYPLIAGTGQVNTKCLMPNIVFTSIRVPPT